MVGDPSFHLALEVAPGDVDGAGQGALLVFVRLANVEDHRARLAEVLRRGRGVHLTDPGFGVAEQVTEARHTEILPCGSPLQSFEEQPGALARRPDMARRSDVARGHRPGRSASFSRRVPRAHLGPAVGSGAWSSIWPFASAACAAIFRTGPCHQRSWTGSSTWPGGRRRPGTPRAGRSWSWRDATRPGASGRPTPTRPGWPNPDHPGVLNGTGARHPVLQPAGAISSATPAPDKAAAGLATEGDWPAPYWLIDTAFATMLVLLGAVDAGLGALFFRIHGEAHRLRTALGVPDGWDPIGVVALGWPDGRQRPWPRPRRPLDEVMHRGGW